MHKAIQEFLDRTRADRKLWQFLEVRVLAFLIRGDWHNRFTRITLLSEGRPGAAEVILLDRDPLWAAKVILPAEDLSPLLKEIQSGRWTIADRVIHYLEEPFSEHPRPHDRWNTWTYASAERHNDKHGGDGCQFLASYGGATTNLYSQIEDGRQALEKLAASLKPRPYRHLTHLVATVLGDPPVEVDGQCGIEVIAPYQVRFTPDSLRWTEGSVRGTITATAQEAAALSLVTAFPSDPASPDVLQVSMEDWEDGPGGTQLRRFAVEANDYAAVTVLLHCAETVVQQSDIARPIGGPLSPAQVVYLLADPGLQHLSRLLSPTIDPDAKGRRSKARQRQMATADDFAAAVGRLFTLSGWQVDVLQRGETSDFVDAVAFHPAERVCLAIECTVTAPSREGKLSNLAARRNRIEKELGAGWEVLALLVTPVERDGVADSDRKAAGTNGSILLDGEGLTSLLALVREGAGPSRILEELRRRLPQPERRGVR